MLYFWKSDDLVKEGVSTTWCTSLQKFFGKKWRKLLVGGVYSSRLHVVVIDEAHTVVKWSVV